jgi:outer membrane protein assembly factor BamB
VNTGPIFISGKLVGSAKAPPTATSNGAKTRWPKAKLFGCRAARPLLQAHGSSTVGGKDGTYYLLNEYGYPVWSRRVVFGGSIGGFFGGAAFDGQHIFSATAVGDPPGFFRCSSDLRDLPLQEPSMHALNLFPLNAAGGSILWQRLFNQSFGATSLSNGVVFSGGVGIPSVRQAELKAYDARYGWLLKTFLMPGSVNSAAVPVGRMLFVTSGNSTDGTGGGVHAFVLP